MGSMKDKDTGHPFPWPIIRKLLDERIEFILNAVEAPTWQGYLTGKDNFRETTATILPYKGHRNRGDRPFWYYGIYNYLRDVRSAIVVDNREADDQLAIHHVDDDSSTVLCSRDKDLLQVPGWHYTWPSWKQEEQTPRWISELEGLRFFYGQMLTGDSADNIPGLYNVGPKAACVKRIQEYVTELQMFNEVKHQYELRFGNYWDMFMAENGRLLWMLRHEDDDWYDRQKELTWHSQ